MRYEVCAVLDSAVSVYARPMFVRSVAEATRAFVDEVNRAAEDNQLFQHPEDFSLWHLSAFDDEKGEFQLVKMDRVCRAQDVKRPA